VTKVRIPPTLRNEVGGERELVGEGETVREILDDIAGRYPALEAQLFEDGDLAPFVNVYVGGEDVRTLDGLETRVNGASVILLPAMAGGAPASPDVPGSAWRSRRVW
jgi:sulfur-carrier protein